MAWREIAVTVTPEGEEAVADLFYQLGCPGVSVDDPALLSGYIGSGAWDYHDFGEVVLTGTAVVKGYLPEDEALPQKLARLRTGLRAFLERFPSWVLQVKGLTVKEEDWENAWKAYFKPVRLGRFLIKPTWETAAAGAEEIVLEIDPGMAFGTGTHPTTTLCLAGLEERVQPGMRVFDVGAGSGILAIAAAKLGAEVEAVDSDELAVRVARENVALNQVQDRVTVTCGDLGVSLTGQADVVVANIVATVILRLLADVPRLLKRGGQLILCGVIETRAEEVAAAILQAGLVIADQKNEAGWVRFRINY
ncbi:MAG: 50S ribosomal protein L11 methyltransferase [Peptococcaceae bacterium]|jgi:ribosomal protein L11 methyltransferase|nr:50S ribosomal protein L11 methyltransferase [Peptococcaceae bacterium]